MTLRTSIGHRLSLLSLSITFSLVLSSFQNQSAQLSGQETFSDAVHTETDSSATDVGSVKPGAYERETVGQTIQNTTQVSANGLRSNRVVVGQPPETKEKRFADQFWNYLLSNNYKHWSSLPGQSADFFPPTMSNNPHGPLLKIYANRIASGNRDSLPSGSILILENYEMDRSLQSILVMYKSPGFNPAAGNWFWVNYQPDGSVTKISQGRQASELSTNGTNYGAMQTSYAAPVKRVAGRETRCIQCHQSAAGNDFVFSNDIRPEETIRQVSGSQVDFNSVDLRSVEESNDQDFRLR